VHLLFKARTGFLFHQSFKLYVRSDFDGDEMAVVVMAAAAAAAV
jgi:hypothetical protein